jgi:hypothetical protein
MMNEAKGGSSPYAYIGDFKGNRISGFTKSCDSLCVSQARVNDTYQSNANLVYPKYLEDEIPRPWKSYASLRAAGRVRILVDLCVLQGVQAPFP